MDRSKVIYLISVTYSVDSIGQRIPTETKRKVFAEITSVTADEFFSAGRSGLNPEIRASVFEPDYKDETAVEYNGKRYGVYRTYKTKNETIELYLEKKAGVTNG